MNFNPNNTPIEIIKEGAFGGIYFRDIYSDINKKQYKNSWKEFIHLKNIDAKFYASDYYDVNVIKQILMVGFSGILGTGQVEYQNMIKDKLIDGKKL